jgi:antitoxin CptB
MDKLAKLYWHCRRGTLELDTLLCRYLDNCYDPAAASEKQAFEQLLQLQDSDLLAYLFGERRPVSADLIRLVDKIRNLPAA